MFCCTRYPPLSLVALLKIVRARCRNLNNVPKCFSRSRVAKRLLFLCCPVRFHACRGGSRSTHAFSTTRQLFADASHCRMWVAGARSSIPRYMYLVFQFSRNIRVQKHRMVLCQVATIVVSGRAEKIPFIGFSMESFHSKLFECITRFAQAPNVELMQIYLRSSKRLSQ